MEKKLSNNKNKEMDKGNIQCKGLKFVNNNLSKQNC